MGADSYSRSSPDSEEEPTRLQRRAFLKLAVAAGTAALAGSALAACAPAASPTSVPGGAATAPGGAPTTAPAGAPTTASKPAAAGRANVIKMISSLPRTGASRGQTDTIVNGYRMALEEANLRAGDLMLEYDDWDDATAAAGKWTAEKESENANRAVADPDITVYHGTYNSGAAAVAIPILNRASLVQLSPANTWPGLTKPGNWDPGEPNKYYPTGKRNYARVVAADDLQGPAGANLAKDLGAKRIYILDDTETYGKGIATLVNNKAKEIGLTVVAQESIDTKAPDYRTLATKIKGSNPDLVYFGGIEDNNGPKLITDLRAVLGSSFPIIVPDGMVTANVIKTTGASGEGVYGTFAGQALGQYSGKAADWLKKYRDKYKGDPDVYAIYGYEAMNVAIAAIKKAGKKDREAIREAVMGTKDYDGVLGKWSFTETGDTTLTDITAVQNKDGKWAFFKALSPK